MKKIRNSIVNNVLSALAVALFGFILLNITFLFDALYQGLVDVLIKLFTPIDVNMAWNWFPPVKHAIFVVIIGLISWFVFRLKIKDIYKAIYMTAPLAVVFATIGIFFYRWIWASYLIGILFALCILYYLYRTKQPWMYYYTLILISLLMLLVALLGVEI